MSAERGTERVGRADAQVGNLLGLDEATVCNDCGVDPPALFECQQCHRAHCRKCLERGRYCRLCVDLPVVQEQIRIRDSLPPPDSRLT